MSVSRQLVLQSLVMGIAMASNVGGMTSPISSPQNIFAIALMAQGKTPPNWLEWFVVALPVACVCNLLIWLWLLFVYRPGASSGDVRPLPAPTDPITVKQVRRHASAAVHGLRLVDRPHFGPCRTACAGCTADYGSCASVPAQVVVVATSVITVVLWCCSTAWADIVGNQGIVALLPLITFFGSGILDKDDFNSFLWHVVMLAQVRLFALAVAAFGPVSARRCCQLPYQCLAGEAGVMRRARNLVVLPSAR